MVYLQNILKRKEEELVKRIYHKQNEDILPGDWCELVKHDFEMIKEEIDEEAIANMTETVFKKHIKTKVREAAYEFLVKIKDTHKKVKDITHDNLKEPQSYLVNPNFTNEECSLLFNMRCKTVKGIKDNFSSMYVNDMSCPLCHLEVDTLKHCLTCVTLKSEVNIRTFLVQFTSKNR